ncbi:MAG: hypothetical protein ACRDNT_13995, partial [Streptosporangiaceae bacterium]
TEIITKLDIDRGTGHGAPTREIAEAVRRREHLADSLDIPLVNGLVVCSTEPPSSWSPRMVPQPGAVE